ncbi:uncharacterized protein LOC124916075 [Impatiens glandulifera]|uniref:uncharacterized protein LOC124916075 n=1 Tax=Impatiens glandulifera TaxID=253017 RepID=UPI001FB0D439|nr:uncharacterized protein LOC124916075 [Impatiens glandulifera]
MLALGFNIQYFLDLFVAGFSLMIGLGFFTFIAAILCSIAFLNLLGFPFVYVGKKLMNNEADR